MASLAMFINGQEIQAEEGKTVLEAATAAGVDIPRLCHHPSLSNWGGCRMCLVEVEPRGLLASSCTYPVSAGLRVHTASEKVVRAREFVLQWLFSERSHYCMYCAASGECELQAEAYRHDLNHWLWSRPNKPMPVDATREFFIMDHNRCILCRRCVRGCGEISHVHTLDLGQRGAKTTVVADLSEPFGESSCISCGTCLQACPTGALIDRRSAFMGTDKQLDATASVCFECGVGCAIVGRTRSDRLVRIEGDYDGAVNSGLLCRAGRFEPLYVGAKRVTTPMRRVAGQLEPCTWEEALTLVGERLGAARASQVATLVSARATNEELDALRSTFAGASLSLLGGDGVVEAPGGVARLDEIADAGAVVALGAELLDEHEVVACFARAAYDKGADIYVLGGSPGTLTDWATIAGPMSRVADVAQALAGVENVVVLYGPEAEESDLAAFAGLTGVTYLGLPDGTNTVGAMARKISRQPANGATAVYVYAADDPSPEAVADGAAFVVAHAHYQSALTAAADVVLPALHWSEKEGHLTNLEGKVQQAKRLTTPPAEVWDDRAVFAALGEMLVSAAERV